MVWGVRLLLVAVGLGVVGILVLVLVLIVRPVVTEAVRANAAGSWWLPFLPDGSGSYGPLAANHWWSAMRAERPGSGVALGVRWGFWTLVSLLLVFAAASTVVSLVRLLARGWSAVG